MKDTHIKNIRLLIPGSPQTRRDPELYHTLYFVTRNLFKIVENFFLYFEYPALSNTCLNIQGKLPITQILEVYLF